MKSPITLNILWHLNCFFPPVYSFNLVKGSWQELPRLVPERGYHGIAAIDGEMFVAGGFAMPGSETLDTGQHSMYIMYVFL